MPEPIGEKLREFQSRSTEVQDIDELFPPDEKKNEYRGLGITDEEASPTVDAVEAGRGNLTPERVARHWEKLSAIEKKFTLAPQEQFDQLIDKYEETHGEKKASRIKAFRKLIQSGDKKAAKINL